LCSVLIALLIVGCQPAPPIDMHLTETLTESPLMASAAPVITPHANTETATPDSTLDSAIFCADVDTAWGLSDWPRVIQDLETVKHAGKLCNGQDPTLTLYPAYYNYGAALEAVHNVSGAIDAYRRALTYNPQGREAALALKKQGMFTPQPLAVCSPQHAIGAQAAIAPYVPVSAGAFASVQGSGFAIGGVPFAIHGVNYYPAQAPWQHFLINSTPDILRHDLDLIQGAGLNMIRIFIAYDALFECPGSGVVPNVAAFARLDSVIQLAAQRGLHVLVTLNDLPDLTFHPLYTEPDTAAAQTAYIVMRYRDEPAVFAWDVRNEGDVDTIRGYAAAHDVADWLTNTVADVRARDPHHLITAGWDDYTSDTADIVDFLSFHHWSTVSSLHERATALQAITHKPIVLEEVGYQTFGSSEATQADRLHQLLAMADSVGLAGWLIWDAFDTTPQFACVPPNCPGKDNAEYHFGLWNADGTPKQAVQFLQAHYATPASP